MQFAGYSARFSMMDSSSLPPIDWVNRVNRSWLVRAGLDAHASAWLEHLESLADGRLLPSCVAARAMCGLRTPLEDPKPWFYAGLFSLATAEEARSFLETHRVTRAVVPSMRDDPAVLLWLDRVGPETRDLVVRLRKAIDGIQT